MKFKTIGLASDHAGFALKQFVKQYCDEHGYAYKDYGTFTDESCDYPDFGHALAKGIEKGDPSGIMLDARDRPLDPPTQ